MKIIINSKYLITSSTEQMVVAQRSNPPKFDEKGEEVVKPIGYLSTLAQCYKFLLHRQIRESSASGFTELMEEVARIEAELNESIRI